VWGGGGGAVFAAASPPHPRPLSPEAGERGASRTDSKIPLLIGMRSVATDPFD
jgi:hypothetical protein